VPARRPSAARAHASQRALEAMAAYIRKPLTKAGLDTSAVVLEADE